MVVALLTYLTFQIWLMPNWHKKNSDMVDVLLVHKKSRYGGCPVGTKQNPYMVDVLLVHKKFRHCYYLTSIFKIKEREAKA